MAYSLIETAKLSGLDPEDYLRQVQSRIADHPAKRSMNCCHGTWPASEPDWINATVRLKRCQTRPPVSCWRADRTLTFIPMYVEKKPPVTQLRFCVDCRFAELHTSPDERWVCAHPTSLWQPPQSLVTGSTPKAYQLECFYVRTLSRGTCGSEGRHWARRDP